MYQQILPSIRRPIVAAALASALLTAGASEAGLFSYEGTAEITATEMPGEIDVGDLFDFTLTYDDASIDEEVSPGAGNFPTGLTAFTLTRRPTNTGTWDPAVGSFALPGRAQTQETSSRFRFQPGGTGFDTLNGSDFDIVDLLLQPVVINDTGLDQTIAEQLGGPLWGNLADFTDPSMHIFSVNFDRADGEVIAFVRGPGLFSYEGTAEITATEMPGEIDVGDLFDFTLTYDDASIDEEVSPGAGNFPTGLTAFTLTRRPTNTGTWDPAVGSFALPGRAQTQETSSRFRFQPGGTGFDTLNGSDFDIVDLLLQPVAINDTGLGQTIAEQLGGPLSGDLADFTDPSMNIFSVNFDRADGEVIDFVPEPGSISLLAGLCLVASLARRR